MAKVMLTGAFGNVGEYTLRALVAEGHEVVAFDTRSDATVAKADRMAGELAHTTVWGDLTDAAGTRAAVAAARPDAIVHVAAIIAPLAYVRPELAHRVNVEGTRNLIAAARACGEPRFVFTSSYSVHGPRNPHRGLAPIDGDTPVDPRDNTAGTRSSVSRTRAHRACRGRSSGCPPSPRSTRASAGTRRSCASVR